MRKHSSGGIGNNLADRFTAFLKDTSANLTVTFAFLSVAAVMFVGSAMDYGRAVTAKNAISNTIDAAALAGARKLVSDNGSNEEVTATVADVISVNFLNAAAAGAELTSLNVTTLTDQGEVKVDANIRVPTTFTTIAGLSHIDVSLQSSASFLLNKDVELAMMMDLTGSMGGSRIADLKVAAKDLIDVLMPEGETSRNKVRIGLVPYSQGVNAGSYAATATNGVSSSCATERAGLEAYTDADYLGAPIGNGSSNCPSSKVLPITEDRDVLISNINAFGTGGYTAGHTGIAWSWYMLSPSWSSLWPGESLVVPYGDEDTVKVAILMTDGAFNTVYNYVTSGGGSSYVEEYQPSQSRARARSLCDAMKTADIKIYTVAFQVSSSSAKAVMQDCASEEKMYFDAQNGAELRGAFRMIAGKISDLRISK